MQFNMNASIVDVRLLNTFQYQTIYETQANQMILTQTIDNQIIIYDITGFQIIDTYTPSHQIKHLTLNPRSDEVLVTTLGYDNTVKVAKIEKRKIKQNITQEEQEIAQPKGKRGKIKERFRYTLKKDLEFPLDYGKFQAMEEEFELQNNDDGEILQQQNENSKKQEMQNLTEKQKNIRKFINRRKEDSEKIKKQKLDILQKYQYTSMCYVIVKGNKYFLFGDNDGNIHTYHRNGTYSNMLNVALEPIKYIIKSPSSASLYATNQNIGFYNPQLNEVQAPYCDIINDGVQQIIFDQNYNNYIYILTNKQQIIIQEIRNSDKTCQFKYLLDSDYPLGHKIDLISIRNSLLLLDQQNNLIKVYNTTNINQEDNSVNDEPYYIQVQKRKLHSQDSKVYYGIQKSTGIMSYLVYGETYNNETEIGFFEVSTPQKKDSDFLNNLRWPIVIVAVVGVFGYQFYNRSKKGEKSNKGMNKDEMEKYSKLLGDAGLGDLAKGLTGGAGGNNKSSKKTPSSGSSRASVRDSFKDKKRGDLRQQDLDKLNKYKDTLNQLNMKSKSLGKQIDDFDKKPRKFGNRPSYDEIY